MKNGVIGFTAGIIVTVGIFIILFFGGIINVDLQKSNKVNYIPTNGYVPDKETAIKIAESVWLPIYGKDIYEEQPFVAKLNDDIWTVTGTLPQVEGMVTVGGVAEIDISKKDGRILRVIHGK